MKKVRQFFNDILDAWIEARKLQAEYYIKNHRGW